CQNAEVVEAFCPVAISRSNPRRSIHQPSVAALHAPVECPLHYLRFPGPQTLHVASCSRRAYHRERRRHLIAPAAEPVPNFPRLRALALFRRRPVERAGLSLLPASKNQHKLGSLSLQFLTPLVALGGIIFLKTLPSSVCFAENCDASET